ncbi:MAG TPA: efflux RND transporter periplasmic adaptor subunit [Sphingomonas sp.]|nr:efflux RND transporter periplasmic adaptor subunit [Sphingomonas sp.]
MSPRGRRLSWILGICGVVLLILIAIWLGHRSSSSGGRGRYGGRLNAPATVGTAKATNADLPVTLEALGTVTPAATVTVRPQVSGTITQILFREGQMVKKGQPIVVIDPRPYQAALLQAQGALTRDEAQLANARLTLQRYNLLLSQDSIARQDRDTQAALVQQLEGTIKVDKGQVDQAKINLGYTRIVSPVAGRIGLKVVDVGNYVGAGDATGVAVVTTLQPIDVEFAIPQEQAPAIEKRVAQGAEIPAAALDATRTNVLDTGRFSTLDNQVDTATGTIKGKARFANAAFQLYPSQFVNIRLTVDTVHDAIVVPPSAVRTGQDGAYVWLLNPDRTVSERKVVTGIANANQVQIVSGLKVGDTVVTAGGDRLSDGATVRLPGDKVPEGGYGFSRGRGRNGQHGGRGNWRRHHGGGNGQAAGNAQAGGNSRSGGGNGRSGQAQGG